MEALKKFYKNKKVLITGHTGFKGSWLAIWLKQWDAEVSGIALDPKTDRDLFLLAGLAEKVNDYRQDIRDLEKVKKIFKKEEPEVVFHLAAQALVIPGYENPVDTFSTNTMGTVNILEACRHTESVKQIVVATTDKVYENKESFKGYCEKDPLGGYDPYSASKAAAEIVTQSYNRSFIRSVATVRAGNVIGGGDWSDNRIVPDCIRSLEKNEKIIIRNPDAIRPWQYVLDPLSAYLMLPLKLAEDPLKYSGAWNFGPEEQDFISVKELVNLIIKYWGYGVWKNESIDKNYHETNILKLDINKAKQIMGWQPVLKIDEAVRMTIEWYKEYLKQDIYQLCLSQIKKYSKKWNSGSPV